MIETDFGLARQVVQILTEEKHGRLLREAKAIEDAQVKATQKQLGRVRPDAAG